MTPEQVIEARALLGWNRDQLAARCGVGSGAIRMFEMTGRVPQAQEKAARGNRLGLIQAAFKSAGIEFTNEGAPGAKLNISAP